MSSSGAGTDDEGVASEDKASEMGALEVEGVPGAAVCSLLTLGTRNSSPSSRAADTK